ncbi:mediator of RNA polymerase II transcription subunit 22 isoform X1 [Brachionichthys hirsutus]|uniref:mediator of RNA polymerase II transcription subunit 22 isoform X1 n=1 Tax=Brachionichthys hirsutus TaxID=412623 RepID=UPI00360487D4
MATQRALPQGKEMLLQNYNKRLKDDIKSILDNFTEIIKTAKIEDETQVSRATQAEQDHYEMHVRAANIVRAGESLMKLVSDLKQFLILNDFPSVNDAISLQNQQLRSLQEECDKKLTSLRDEIAIDLYELEEEYYSSRSCKRTQLLYGSREARTPLHNPEGKTRALILCRVLILPLVCRVHLVERGINKYLFIGETCGLEELYVNEVFALSSFTTKMFTMNESSF